jgi:hypothetical protein
MRRSLPFVSLALVLLGLELTTESISLTFARLRTGLTSVVRGVEVHVPMDRFLFGIGSLLVGLVLGFLLFVAARQRRAVAVVGHACPNCGSDTHRVRRGRLRRAADAVLGERLTRRHCEGCGWTGLSLRH